MCKPIQLEASLGIAFADWVAWEVRDELTIAEERMARKKILIVDDSSTARMMEKILLGPTGYELITAQNGQEAVEKATEGLPDLILMDVVMPQVDGVEACRRLRSQESTRQIPIIMVTTRGEEHALEAAFQAGCSDYLPKPITGTDLLSKVRHHLGD